MTDERRPDSKTPVHPVPPSPTHPRDLSEENVRAKIRAGDIANATATALLLHGAEVFGFLAGVLDDPAAARDVYDGFRERLWSGLGRVPWSCALRTWMYAIARSELGQYRESPRRGGHDVPLPGAAPGSAPPRITPQPHARATLRDVIVALRVQLAPEDREILILRVDRELPWREIAIVFLGGAASEQAIARESARLRQQYQDVKRQLAKLAADQGILFPSD